MEKRPLGVVVFLMAFLVISAMHAAPAQAEGGRALAGSISGRTLDPNRPHHDTLIPDKPGGGRGRGRECTSIYECPSAAEP
ncbi:unnamed protein product [Urochloa decumbens]|uniref:Uncharacterized protein n=1 Tax=Urochloa decumbens TaxID=240449 RepID=A0ABC8XWM6_9POAL